MFTIQQNTLTSAEYAALYASVGWTPPSEAQIALALAHSDLTVSVYDNGQLIAMGRMISGHAISFFIKDVAVRPEYQGRGAGKLVMETLIAFIQSTVPEGYHVSMELISSEGKKRFTEPSALAKSRATGWATG